MHGADIVDSESASHLNGNFLASAVKFPVERSPCFWISKPYALVSVAFKVEGLFRAPLALEIGRCCHGQDARIEELTCHKTGRSRVTKSDRKIKSVGDHIPKLVSCDQFQSELWILIEK